MDDRDERRTLNEVAFRDLNEEIHQSNGANGSEVGVVCECGSADCVRVVKVTRNEYEAVRSIPTWFIVAPGHRQNDIERVVLRDERYMVVEKVGEAGELAEETDPRSDDLVAEGT
jgi:hypothetical protein